MSDNNRFMNEMVSRIIEPENETEKVLKEINEEDFRFANNKNITLNKATLGQTGQILDLILHPPREEHKNAHCQYLECDPDDLIRDTKQFPAYKANLFKYVLFYKDKKYKKEDLNTTMKNSDGKSFDYCVSASESKDFQIINISQDKTVRIPTRIHVGMKKGSTKFIMKLVEDFNYFAIQFYYVKGKEKVIDDFIDYLNDLVDKNNFYKGQKISPGMDFLKLGNITWNDIFLDSETKEKISNNILDFFEKEEIYKKNGISSKCGLIWEGPPGTGKTLAGRVVASVLEGITFIWITPDDVRSASDVKSIYKIAKDLGPSVVFFEDADLYCVDRGRGGRNPVLGEIMNQLDGLVPLEGVVTIFTTNDPDVLEQALIDRPGRFDERVEFLPPKALVIVKMMKKFLTIPSYDEDDFDDIAEKSEKIKLTGAHIKRLCDLSTIFAIKDDSLDENDIAQLKKEHFEKAFENIKDMKIKAGESKADYLKNKKKSNISYDESKITDIKYSSTFKEQLKKEDIELDSIKLMKKHEEMFQEKRFEEQENINEPIVEEESLFRRIAKKKTS